MTSDPTTPLCLSCDGKGRVGPFWTSPESADVIARMTEREKERLRMDCPVCGGSGKAPDGAPTP